MKTVLAIITALGLSVALAGAADAHHGHKFNGKGEGHKVKTEGRYAGDFAPGHAKHHEE